MINKIQTPLTRSGLAKIKTKAIRRGLWFKVLSKAERAYMQLLMKLVERVRSLLVAKVVASIMEKLLDAMESKVKRVMREVGRPLAHKLSRVALSWGNSSATQWAKDINFVQYLAIMRINMSPIFKL